MNELNTLIDEDDDVDVALEFDERPGSAMKGCIALIGIGIVLIVLGVSIYRQSAVSVQTVTVLYVVALIFFVLGLGFAMLGSWLLVYLRR